MSYPSLSSLEQKFMDIMQLLRNPQNQATITAIIFSISLAVLCIDITGFILSNWENYLHGGGQQKGVVPAEIFNLLLLLQLVFTLAVFRDKRKKLAFYNETDDYGMSFKFLCYVFNTTTLLVTSVKYFAVFGVTPITLDFEVINNSPSQLIIWWCFLIRVLVPVYLVLTTIFVLIACVSVFVICSFFYMMLIE